MDGMTFYRITFYRQDQNGNGAGCESAFRVERAKTAADAIVQFDVWANRQFKTGQYPPDRYFSGVRSIETLPDTSDEVAQWLKARGLIVKS